MNNVVNKEINLYTEKELVISEKILGLILKSGLLNDIKLDMKPLSVSYNYCISYEVLKDLCIDNRSVRFNVYDFYDNLVYQKYIPPETTSGLYYSFYFNHSHLYPDLVKCELIGFSDRFNYEIPFQTWDKRIDTIMNEKLKDMYGITYSNKIYKLIKDGIYNEIKNVIEKSQMQFKDSQIGGGKNLFYQSDGWNITFG
jgi:hypothetical protein